jgi:hypothetical protein
MENMTKTVSQYCILSKNSDIINTIKVICYFVLLNLHTTAGRELVLLGKGKWSNKEKQVAKQNKR